MMVDQDQLLSWRNLEMKKWTSSKCGMVGIVVWFMTFSLLSHCLSCAPIQTPDFSSCMPASYPNSGPNGTTKTVSCCPPVSSTPPVQFTAPPAPATLRVRPAVQCANSTYGWQLERAYQLMRSLPDSDPRSLVQQANVHCAYCGGAFLQSGNASSYEAIDIHYSWLFFAWHRMFLHFHERILQSLLDDTSFSLPFWNWDNQGSLSPSSASCQQPGNVFPQFYNDPNSSTYDANRNPQHAAGSNTIIDLAYVSDQANGIYNNSTQQVASNLNVMYQALAAGGTTAEPFLGSVYKAGDARPRTAFSPPEASGGTLEMGPHVSVHFWVAQDYAPYLDFGAPWISAYDPVFYAHHANVDRLWSLWNSVGGQDFNDSDWLNASFLFYDENAQLVQVKVSDAVDMSRLGYEYESVDNSWLSYSASKCGTVAVHDLVENFRRIPQPQRPTGERVTLTSGGAYNVILKRTPTMNATTSAEEEQKQEQDIDNEEDAEEMLVVHGINFDPTQIVSFDAFLNLPGASSATSQSCAEYIGRFHHLPLLQLKDKRRFHRRQFMWKVSVTKTLRNLEMDMLPSMLVTLVSFPSKSSSSLSFRSISIERQQRK